MNAITVRCIDNEDTIKNKKPIRDIACENEK
jgi:hypothetical protein